MEEGEATHTSRAPAQSHPAISTRLRCSCAALEAPAGRVGPLCTSTARTTLRPAAALSRCTAARACCASASAAARPPSSSEASPKAGASPSAAMVAGTQVSTQKAMGGRASCASSQGSSPPCITPPFSSGTSYPASPGSARSAA